MPCQPRRHAHSSRCGPDLSIFGNANRGILAGEEVLACCASLLAFHHFSHPYHSPPTSGWQLNSIQSNPIQSSSVQFRSLCHLHTSILVTHRRIKAGSVVWLLYRLFWRRNPETPFSIFHFPKSRRWNKIRFSEEVGWMIIIPAVSCSRGAYPKSISAHPCLIGTVHEISAISSSHIWLFWERLPANTGLNERYTKDLRG